MKKKLSYLNEPIDCQEVGFLRLKSMDKLIFLKEPVYYKFHKPEGSLSFFGTETKPFSGKCQKVSVWTAQSDSDLLREVHENDLVQGIASINE